MMNITPKPITVIPTQRQMSLIRFSPNDEFLYAAGRDGKIHRWDMHRPYDPPADALRPSKRNDPDAAPSFLELPELAGHDGWVTQIAFHPKGTQLFTADSWGRLMAWSLIEELPKPQWNLARAHDGWIRQVSLSPEATQIATCGKDKAIRIWSAADGTLQQEFANQPDDIFSLAFHPDGKSLVTGDLKGIVKDWDLASGKVAREFDAKIMYLLSYIQEVGGVRVLKFDAAGRTLAVAGAQPTSGGFVQAVPILKFFDWTDGKEIQSIKLGENTLGFVTDLASHVDGYWLGVCSGQPGHGNVFLHRVGDEKPFVTQALPNCHSVALGASGKRFAAISNAGTFGQIKSMAREGIYSGNFSPINLFDLATV